MSYAWKALIYVINYYMHISEDILDYLRIMISFYSNVYPNGYIILKKLSYKYRDSIFFPSKEIAVLMSIVILIIWGRGIMKNTKKW